MNKDFYSILGLDKNNFSEDALKKSYRKLSKQWHPDRMSGKSEAEKKEAEEKMKEINEAYETLSNPEKKAAYDNPGFGGFEHGDWGDPFAEMKAHFRREQQQAAKRGSDIQMKIPVTIDEILHGTEKKVKYRRNIRCSSCEGQGGHGKMTCPYCHGQGYITETRKTGPYSIFQQTVQCPHCGGKGFKMQSTCSDCGGTGFKTKEEILKVHFEPGIQQGAAIQFTSMGNESKYKDGAEGSFFAIPVYKYDHEEYSLEQFPNIIHKIDVNMVDALIGGKMALDLEGLGKTEIDIPSCTKPGGTITLEGKGATIKGNPFGWGNDTQRGDYILVVNYKMPEKLTSKQKDLLKEFKKTLD